MAEPPEKATHALPRWVLGVAMVLVAVNLRHTMAGLPPLIPAMRRELDLGSTAIGTLTTLPVLCMGVFAPAAPALARRLGAVRTVGLGTLLLVLGPLARWQGQHLWLLYLGTLLAGIGIAIVGALLPQLVKTWFPPERAGAVTGLYFLAMMAGAAGSAALAVPLADWFGSWQASLGSWALLSLVGGLAWLPVRHRPDPPAAAEPGPDRMPFGSGTAWLLAAYMSVQSWTFYTSLAWLAPGYVEQGWNPQESGFILSVFSAAQVVGGLVAPVLADRATDRRGLLLVASALSGLGVLGLVLAPMALPWVWVFVMGLGQGAAFPLGLVLVVAYADSPAASGRLASMVFLVSYGVAAFGPVVMGALRDATGGFRAVWVALVVLAVAQGVLSARLRPGLQRVG